MATIQATAAQPVTKPPTDTLRTYYQLAKPGIVYGNDLAALGGFLLGSKGQINIWLGIFTLVGLSLVIGSACAFNNYLDRNIDRKMARTRRRALPEGRVAGWQALTYAATLGVFGLFLLTFFIDVLAAYIAFAGLILYVVVYGIAKRTTPYSTIIGSVAGATPPAVGYVAATSHVDLAAVILFVALALWQMPHFYAIAIFRQKDYEAARLPVLPIKKGVEATKKQIVIYTAAFTLAAASLTAAGYSGYTYLAVMLVAGAYWLGLGLQGFKRRNEVAWARQVFGVSLIVLVVFCVMLSITYWLP